MALYQFNGPTGVVTVTDDLAKVYRKNPAYSEILPEPAEGEEAPAPKNKSTRRAAATAPKE